MLGWFAVSGQSHLYHFLLIIIIVFALEATNLPFDFRHFRKQTMMYLEPMASYYNATNHATSTLRPLYLNEKLKLGANSSEVIEDRRPIHEIVVTIPDIVSNSKAKYLIQGGEAFLACENHPPLRATWQENLHHAWFNQLGQALTGDRYHHFSNGTLFLRDVQAEDSGWYSCQATYTNVLAAEATGETFHHRIIVYSAPAFGFMLKWDYRITNCVRKTELDYTDWIYGHLVTDVCSKTACAIQVVSVKCLIEKMPPPSKELRVEIYLSSTVPSSAHCDITCVEIAEADTVTVALKKLKIKLKANLKTILPSSDSILLFLPSTFHSQFKMTCSPGYEMKFKVCTACDAGTISTTSVTACSPCKLGFFVNKSGSSACHQCPVGTTTTAMGASNEKQCTGIQWQTYLPYAIIGFCGLLVGIFGGVFACKMYKRKRDSESVDYEDEAESEETDDDDSAMISRRNLREEDESETTEESLEEDNVHYDVFEDSSVDELNQEDNQERIRGHNEEEGNEEDEDIGSDEELDDEEYEDENEEVENETENKEEKVEKEVKEEGATEVDINQMVTNDDSKETKGQHLANAGQILADSNESFEEYTSNQLSTPKSSSSTVAMDRSEMHTSSEGVSSLLQADNEPIIIKPLVPSSSESPKKLSIRKETRKLSKRDTEEGRKMRRKWKPVAKLLTTVKEKKTQKVINNEILD